jgi:hypothetical protein
MVYYVSLQQIGQYFPVFCREAERSKKSRLMPTLGMDQREQIVQYLLSRYYCQFMMG